MADETTYPIRIECGNCFSRANYEIERGVVCNDADLVCPNCGCNPKRGLNGKTSKIIQEQSRRR